MKFFGACLLIGLGFCGVTGCTRTSTKSPDVAGAVRQSLDQSGLKDVSVRDDRDNGVVTLGGHVASEDAKRQAESIARTFAGGASGPLRRRFTWPQSFLFGHEES